MDTVLFRGAVQILEPSQYYVDANAGGYDIPAVFLEAGATYQLVNGEGDAVNAPVPSTATAVRQYVNTAHPYYDLFDKAQFHDADNAGYDERDTLLYFGGKRVNEFGSKSQRQLMDIIYFASAEGSGKNQ